MEELTPDEIRKQFPPKLVDRFLISGYKLWFKRQNPQKSLSRLKRINVQLRGLSSEDLKSLISKLK